MDWQLQKNDGTWVESNKLPEDTRDYQTAVLLDGTEKVVTLKTLSISTHELARPIWVVY